MTLGRHGSEEVIVLEQLAAEVHANRPEAPSYGYPHWLRDKVVAATADVVGSGGSVHHAARVLGLNPNTVRRWMREQPHPDPTPSFRPVLIAGTHPSRRFRLRAPSGYQVDDLELPDLVALLRELG